MSDEEIATVSVPLRGYRHERSQHTKITNDSGVAFPSPCGVIGMKALSFKHCSPLIWVESFRPLAGL